MRVQIDSGGQLMSFGSLFRILEDNREFAAWYNQVLADTALPAFFWEHPPITGAVLHEPAEFVLIDAPSLAGITPDRRPFLSSSLPKLIAMW